MPQQIGKKACSNYVLMATAGCLMPHATWAAVTNFRNETSNTKPTLPAVLDLHLRPEIVAAGVQKV